MGRRASRRLITGQEEDGTVWRAKMPTRAGHGDEEQTGLGKTEA